MKKKYLLSLMISCFLIAFPLSVYSKDKPVLHAGDLLSEQIVDRVDTLWSQGMEEAYHVNGLSLIKQSLDLCEAELIKTPDNYEILWRYIRSAGCYGQVAKILQIEGLKGICRKWGKKALRVGEKAKKISPQRVEAYYWQAYAIGPYSSAVGFPTAIREGFYGKGVRDLKKACEIDKSYLDYSPLWATVMLYWKIPWPLKKKKKALETYREWAKLSKWEWEDYERYTYGAEILMGMGKKNWPEAKILLDTTLSAQNQYRYYYDLAKELRSKIKD